MMAGRIGSPTGWYGGKGSMIAKILPLFPPHKVYVEPFGGGASLLIAKSPSEVEVYNDLDSGLVHFFRVLRDREMFAKFYEKVSLTPYAREEFDFCRRYWKDTEDPIERAYRWFVVARMSFSGAFGGSWSHSVSSSGREGAMSVLKWLSTIEKLPEVAQRMMRVQIEHKDFRDVIKAYDSEDTLFYADPPYVHGTRSEGSVKIYAVEMKDSDHRDLVRILLDVKGRVVLSGYAHEIYRPLEAAGWKRHDFDVVCQAAGRTRLTGILGEGAAKEMQARVESVWVKPYDLGGMFKL